MFKQIVAQHSTIAQVARTFTQNYPQLAHKCNSRIERAQAVAAAGLVFLCQSQRTAYVLEPSARRTYRVERGVFGKWTACDCKDHVKHANTCQHILAAEFAERARALELHALVDQAES